MVSQNVHYPLLPSPFTLILQSRSASGLAQLCLVAVGNLAKKTKSHTRLKFAHEQISAKDL